MGELWGTDVVLIQDWIFNFQLSIFNYQFDTFPSINCCQLSVVQLKLILNSLSTGRLLIPHHHTCSPFS